MSGVFALIIGLSGAAGSGRAEAATPLGSQLSDGQRTTAASTGDGPTITRDQHHDVSPPLRTIRPKPVSRMRREAQPVRPVPQPPRTGRRDAAVQDKTVRTAAAPVPLESFDGVGQGFTGPQGTFTPALEPSDSNSSVGATQIVETVNAAFAVFSKTGTVQFGPVEINTLFSGFGGACETVNGGDPTVRYDGLAKRWVITQFASAGGSTGFLQCVAVSRTSDATGAYNRYAFSFDDFNDYPKLAVWPQAYFMTYNMFDGVTGEFKNGNVCAMDRAAMLAGGSATQQCFSTGSIGSPLASDVDGAAPPPGRDNLVLARGSDTTLSFWHFHVDFANPGNSAFTGPSSLDVAANSSACGTCVPQQGVAQQLDTLGDRLMYRLAYRNFGDHESLVVNQSVMVGDTVGVRWYELRLSGGTPTVHQQSTFSPDQTFRWMGSIATDRVGNVALGYSASSSATHPQIRVTGRLAGDPLNEMTLGEATVVAGAGSQTGERWGDYSSMAIDPDDGCTFWYTQQYLDTTGDFVWRTRLTSFRLAGCRVPTTLTYTGPARIANGTPAHLSGVLREEESGTPVEGRTVTFTLGAGSSRQICSGTTDTSGVAACTITPNQPLNDSATVPLSAAFAGDGAFEPSSTEAQLLLEFMTGRAFGLSADVNLLLTKLQVPPSPDTGPVRTAGASTTDTSCTATITTLLINADALCAKVTTALNPGSSTATTSLDGVTIGIPTLPVIEVTDVTATSVSRCRSATGSTDLATLKIGGVAVPIPTAPNSRIDLPGGTTLTVNEQRPVAGADAGLTVNALHLVGAGGLIDVTVGSSTSDIHNCT